MNSVQIPSALVVPLAKVCKSKNRHCLRLAAAAFALSLSACANPHYFPYERAPFAGLEQVKGTPAAQQALAEAREDFQLALHDQTPVHAHYVETLPASRTKVYAGNGYRLTIVHVDFIGSHRDGPEITLDSSITGGSPRTFDHITETDI